MIQCSWLRKHKFTRRVLKFRRKLISYTICLLYIFYCDFHSFCFFFLFLFVSKPYEKLDNKRKFSAAKTWKNVFRIAIPHDSAMNRKLTVGRDQFWPKTSDYNNTTKATNERQRLALNAAKSNKLCPWRPLVQFLIKTKLEEKKKHQQYETKTVKSFIKQRRQQLNL